MKLLPTLRYAHGERIEQCRARVLINAAGPWADSIAHRIAPAIPVTHAHKKIEVPLKKLFSGHSADAAINRSSLANPESVDWFVERAERYLTELKRHM